MPEIHLLPLYTVYTYTVYYNYTKTEIIHKITNDAKIVNASKKFFFIRINSICKENASE